MRDKATDWSDHEKDLLWSLYQSNKTLTKRQVAALFLQQAERKVTLEKVATRIVRMERSKAFIKDAHFTHLISLFEAEKVFGIKRLTVLAYIRKKLFPGVILKEEWMVDIGHMDLLSMCSYGKQGRIKWSEFDALMKSHEGSHIYAGT